MRQLFYDLETTGLDAQCHAIHQMSGLVVVDGKVVETFDFRVRPFVGAVVSQEALDVSGVTVEQVMQGESEESVFPRFTAMLEKHLDGTSDRFFLCGYNSLRFDDLFLEQFFKRNGCSRMNRYFWHGGIDVMVLAGNHLAPVRCTMPNFRQGTVARTLGIEIDEGSLHDAMYDANVCYEIYRRVSNSMKTE